MKRSPSARPSLILLLLSILFLAACQSNTQGESTPQSPTTATEAATAVPSATLLPATPTSEGTATLAATAGTGADSNCYVHLFDDDNFGDDNDIIYGPGRWETLRNLPGATESDWSDDADSLKVGAGATVTIWEEANFQGRSQRFEAGSEQPTLDMDFRSMEISCP